MMLSRHGRPGVALRTLEEVLVADLLIGLAWTFAAPVRSKTPAYHPLRELLAGLPGDPARWWGGLLVGLALVALLLVVTGREEALRLWMALLIGYYACWVFAFGWAALFETNALGQHDAGLIPVPLFYVAIIGHRRAARTAGLLIRTPR